MRQNHLRKLSLVIISLLLLIVHTTLVLADDPQPVLIKDIYPGGISSNPAFLADVNGTLFFTANGGSGKYGLWRSDGSEAGTIFLSETYGSDLAIVNNQLFFNGFDSTHGTELWKSDGTAAGTVMVKDIFPGIAAFKSSNPYNLTSVNGTLFFAALGYFITPDPSDPYTPPYLGLWKSDGTESGTAMITNTLILPVDSLGGSHGDNMVDLNGTLFLRANNATNGRNDNGLWTSDGTGPGTVFVAKGPAALMINVNGTLFFYGDDGIGGTFGAGLWQSDGTKDGTFLIKSGIYPYHLTSVDNTLFFVTDDGVHGIELWMSNGGSANLVKDINTDGSYNHSSPSDLTNVNGTLFFTAFDGIHSGLWKSDGTAAGTIMVKDFTPKNLTNVNGTLFFLANDGNGLKLWKSDGTSAGTVMVNIDPLMPKYLFNVNGTLFFTADDGDHGVELWKLSVASIGPSNNVFLPIIIK